MNFVIELRDVEVQEGIVFPRLVVAGTYIHLPANRRGHPDTWTPDESELEVNAITDFWGRALPVAIVEHLKDDEDFISLVEKAVTSPQYP